MAWLKIDDGRRTMTIDYHKYIKSDAWRKKAKAAKRRADGRCQICYGKEELNAHHRTYERLGEERPEDITVLCRRCHGLHHSHLAKLKKTAAGVEANIIPSPYAELIEFVCAADRDYFMQVPDAGYYDRLHILGEFYPQFPAWPGFVRVVRIRPGIRTRCPLSPKQVGKEESMNGPRKHIAGPLLEYTATEMMVLMVAADDLYESSQHYGFEERDEWLSTEFGIGRKAIHAMDQD